MSERNVQWENLDRGDNCMTNFYFSSIDRCFGEWIDDEVTCDRYCSVIKGARCREEMIENVRWPRTEATETVTVPCPGKQASDGLKARRSCHITAPPGNKGKWGQPVIDECLGSETKRQLKHAEELSRNKLSAYDSVFPFLNRLVDVTRPSNAHSPNDLAAYIKVAEFLLEFQVGNVLSNIPNFTYGIAK